MAKRVIVSGAEQSAARSIVKRNAAKGVVTRTSVTKIANAKGVSRSAISGRFVAKAQAAKSPKA